ncbi:MAG TPA: VOC family protein [Alphaproteobacteria bacterium]|nr:VOC family protein [Alphaproteobacteria bacterium]
MVTRLNPYLNFRSNARAAMEFYHSVFGGQYTTSSFGDGGLSANPDERDLVMHSQIDGPEGITLMASDTPASMGEPTPNGAVSLSGDDDAQLRGYWDKLAAGATILQPLEKAPWGDSFGMLTDRFGVTWLVNIAGNP